MGICSETCSKSREHYNVRFWNLFIQMNVYLVINHGGLLETSTVPFSVVCCGSACLVKNSEFIHVEMTETGFSISEKRHRSGQNKICTFSFFIGLTALTLRQLSGCQQFFHNETFTLHYCSSHISVGNFRHIRHWAVISLFFILW